MFCCTASAARALREHRERQGLPVSFGVRLFGRPSQENRIRVLVVFTPRPRAGDVISEAHGLRFFIAEHIAGHLEAMTLHAAAQANPAGLVVRLTDSSNQAA